MYRRSGCLQLSSCLLAFMALVGCDGSVDTPSGKPAVVDGTPSASKVVGSAANSNASAERSSERAFITARDEELAAQRAALQQKRSALELERDQLTRQVESHQAEGAKKLAQLKAEWAALERKAGNDTNDPAARQRFAERARADMESSLMMDQEYRAKLEEAEGRLRDTEEKIRSLDEPESLATSAPP